MGDRGPAPRREAERRRTNEPAHPIVKMGPTELAELPFTVELKPEPPNPQDDLDQQKWNTAVQGLWDALLVDPARKWMTSADWALTKIVLQILNDAMGSEDGVTASTQSAVLKHMASIGVTEAARLRMQKEITLFPPAPSRTTEDGKVVDIRDARREDVE